MLSNTDIKRIANELRVQCGLSDGYISRRQALKTYGSWFRLAEMAGRITPVRYASTQGKGNEYKVSEILELLAEDEEKARFQL